MGLTSEIYLTKKHITKEEWNELIKIISNYTGFLKPWKIIITNDNNQIRYFIETKCPIPPTINNLNSFLFKQTNNITIPNFTYSLASILKNESNIIDIINLCEIKNKGIFKYLEINFIKINENKILSRSYYYLTKKNKLIRYHPILSIPTNLLSIDFEGNKRYIYKSPPKYLEINKLIKILNTNCNNPLLNIDTYPYLQDSYYITQNSYSFDKHSLILGSSGCGKSKFISSFIYNIITNKELNQKYKIIVIDPHASLENDIGGIGKVIDFKTTDQSINLFMNNNQDIISSTETLLDLFNSLINTQYNSKLERVLRHSIYLLLSSNSFNFINLKKLLLDIEYRNNLIQKTKHQIPTTIIEFFLTDFNDIKTKSYSEAISPIISFIDEMEMIPAFNTENKILNLTETIKNNQLTLFSLNQTKLGEKVTKTISGLIIEQLLTTIQSHDISDHIIFIIDEIAIIENPILPRYLSESRKYNLSLILAGQYFNQISDKLKDSIFANVINYYIFRVSKKDAISLVDNINIKIPIDDSKETKIKLLTELSNRECIVRIETNGKLIPAFKAKTLDYKSIPKITKNETTPQTKNNKIHSNFKINSNLVLKDILTK